MNRNPGIERSPTRFSPSWVLVSYFLICGGLCAAAAGYGLTGTRDPYAIGAALFVGAGLGGFLAGRASPHRSTIEPALAALLVVGSLVAFVYSTPFGRILVVSHREEVVRTALVLGGVGAFGGLLGALVGEATQPSVHGERTLGWVIQAVFIAAGALFAAVTAAGLILVNEAAAAALFASWMPGHAGPSQPLVSDERAAQVAAAACGSAALVAGFITQLGAPRRALVPAAAGSALVIAGALFALGAAASRAGEMIGPAALFGGMAAVVALVGGLIAFAIGRATGRLSSGRVSDKEAFMSGGRRAGD
ncbi:MAG TPA: hypothetical protein VKB80_14035 [Kofleriaceae bacterium]|nr:hypothetical protein [Kofleriaceae bacterium]